MYQELLDIVRSSEEPDDTSATSSDATRPESTTSHNYVPNMPVVAEESETEYPSFSMKKKGAARDLKRGDSEFDEVIDSVLAENKGPANARRDDLSDDMSDDDLSPSRAAGNPLKDFTFVGGDMTLVPKKKEEPKKPDSITAIRDYLEAELSQDRLF